MYIAIYDKSFDGILTVVFDAFASKNFPDALLTTDESPPLYATKIQYIATETQKAERVFNGLTKKISSHAIRNLLSVWAAETAESGTLLYTYICQVFHSKRSIELDFANKTVLAVNQLAKKVQHERHLMLGFLRFQKTANAIYFASVAPRYNIVPWILEHFINRFGTQPWIIYDTGRKIGFFFDGKKLQEAYVDSDAVKKNGSLSSELLAAEELFFQNLWQTYFSATAIPDRFNPKLQQRLMPTRFHPYMTEMQRE